MSAEGAKCDICGLLGAGKLCLLRAEFNLQFELEFLLTASGRANVRAPLAPPSLLVQLSMEIACYCRLEEDIYKRIKERRIERQRLLVWPCKRRETGRCLSC